jgi:adenine-specific DNA methylase
VNDTSRREKTGAVDIMVLWWRLDPLRGKAVVGLA